MATLTKQTVDRAGSTITFTAATVTVGDDVVAADDGRDFFVVNNGSTGQVSATLMAQTSAAFQDGIGVTSVDDIVKTVAAGAEAYIPIQRGQIRANDGVANLKIDQVTDVTVAAVRLPHIA